MRPIDADKLITYLKTFTKVEDKDWSYDKFIIAYDIIELLENAPIIKIEDLEVYIKQRKVSNV